MKLKKIDTGGRLDVYTVDNFITDEQCDHLMKIIKARHERATIVANKTGKNKNVEKFTGEKAAASSDRTNAACHFLKYDPIAMMYDAKLSKMMGIDITSCDNCQGLFYDTDQRYNCHMDAHVDEGILKDSGQRTWTVMLYLNVPESGGATKFCNFPLEIQPKKGMILLWNNLNVDGTTNKMSRHAGMPVLAGEKYCTVKWFKEFKNNSHSYYTNLPHLKLENYPVNYLK